MQNDIINTFCEIRMCLQRALEKAEKDRHDRQARQPGSTEAFISRKKLTKLFCKIQLTHKSVDLFLAITSVMHTLTNLIAS